MFAFGLWKEYNLIGGLKFYESRLEQEPLLVFTFVVKSENKNKFYELGSETSKSFFETGQNNIFLKHLLCSQISCLAD